MIRLFVGLELADDVRARLASLAGGVPGARWVAEDNLHLTLRFIGEVPGHDADEIHAMLSGIQTRRFEMTISSVGHFSGGGQVKMLWAGVARNPELIALQERVDSALRRAGVPKDRTRFTPHITLARLRDAPIERVSGFLQAHSLLRIGPITVDRFVLFSSHLHADGPIYTVEAEYSLAHAYA